MKKIAVLSALLLTLTSLSTLHTSAVTTVVNETGMSSI